MTTTAAIAKKGCTGTGITEELAKTLHDQLGKTGVAVIEFVSDARTEKRNGDEHVTVSILTCEPAPNQATEDHLRNLARSFHYERKLTEDGPQLPVPGDGPEPTVNEVLAAGTALEPHDYIDGDQIGECDRCGADADATIHSDDAIAAARDTGDDAA